MVKEVSGSKGQKQETEGLIKQARRGDESAIARLISMHLDYIEKRARVYASFSVESEDLVQEGLIALIQAVKTYDFQGEASFRTYACKCIDNRFLSVLRGGLRQKDIPAARTVSLDEEPSGKLNAGLLSENTNSPEDIVIGREKMKVILDDVKSLLSGFEWDTLILFLDGYSYSEIAKRLGASEKSVDNALQRIRRKFKSVSEKDAENV